MKKRNIVWSIFGVIVAIGIIGNLGAEEKAVDKKPTVTQEPKKEVKTETKPVAKPVAKTTVDTEVMKAEKDYIDFVGQKANQLATFIGAISEGSMEVGADPYMMLTDDWKTKQVIAWEGISAVYQEVQNYDKEVPPSLEKANAVFLESLNLLEKSKEYYYSGVDNINAEDIVQSTNLMEESSNLTTQVVSEIQKVADQHK